MTWPRMQTGWTPGRAELDGERNRNERSMYAAFASSGSWSTPLPKLVGPYRSPARHADPNTREAGSHTWAIYINPRMARRIAKRIVRAHVRREVRMTARMRRVFGILFGLLGGCYASHEASCELDEECSRATYCERRLACELEPDGSVTCDPRRLCVIREGRFVDCDGDGEGWLGLCVPPSTRELWQ